MDDLLTLFVATLIVAALLTSISIWAPRRPAVRTIAFGTTLLFVPLSYGGLAELLSKPKPVSLEWARAATAEATVLGSALREGEAIYLWLQLPDTPEPRAYQLPWNLETAKQLQNARRKAEEMGTGLAMRLPFERSWDKREPQFYPLPQQAMPPKDAPGEGPTHLPHPSSDA